VLDSCLINPRATCCSCLPTMESPTTSAAALKLEIERLSGIVPVPLCVCLLCFIQSTSGAIDRHKSSESSQHSTGFRPRSNIYVNPNYKPPSRPSAVSSRQPVVKTTTEDTIRKRDIVLGGVAFESSRRSLVRKDCARFFITLEIFL
jgi:hypothetical protein